MQSEPGGGDIALLLLLQRCGEMRCARVRLDDESLEAIVHCHTAGRTGGVMAWRGGGSVIGGRKCPGGRRRRVPWRIRLSRARVLLWDCCRVIGLQRRLFDVSPHVRGIFDYFFFFFLLCFDTDGAAKERITLEPL